MQYVEFGKLNKKISRFGLGCMRLPRTKTEDGNDIIDETEAIRLIRQAIDQGVNFLDTAYAYAGSEELLGKALKDGYREKVIIQTKSPVWDAKNHEDYQRFFEEQISRLQVEYIDIYLFHCLDRQNWEKVKASGGIEYMEGLKKKGLIKQFGFSFHGEYDLFTEIIDAYAWDVAMIQLNILDKDHQAGVKGLMYAASKQIPVVIMEPLKGGLLVNKIPDEVEQLLNQYDEKRSLVEWAFRWMYHHKEARVILSGISNVEQLTMNLEIFDQAVPDVMSDKDMELMDRIKEIYMQKLRVPCTGCSYCMPCPVNVNIPEIFKIYNDSALSSWPEFGKVFYSLVATNAGRDVSNCVECKACETHCPQNISIANELKMAHQMMKA